ncbi:ABC transporter permease [Elioraea sp. Yellowstone]|jgi:ABC-2 type transport system permease protein|uniref:ABC transporter permease n=1 Tax=Elioraea sp. Yellowstone TaxID=2592070 RepID=UPI00114D74BE|nr:ABC transporter permease [Elioraea sp. Yellowstone]TQF77969.1 ABC transporter permease [Elioraea sp. Yellowstone]
MTGAFRRIWGLVYRHLALYRRSWPRLVELAYWPVLQMCIWGFVTEFMVRQSGWAAAASGVLIGAVLLWEVCLRSQMGFAISFLEEVWSRNLGNLFVAPIRPWELVGGLVAMSVLRMLAGIVPAILLAWALYRFDILAIGPALPLFFANLMAMGWAVALAVTAMVLRYGAGAEALAWSVLFGLAPLSAVFYPVAVLPPWLQPVALAIPATHVFEGMRAALLEGRFAAGNLASAAALNLAWLGAAGALFTAVFRTARRKGLLLNVGE